MRVYVQTDLEGVAGVRNFDEWTRPDKRYYDLARELLTLELNAAIEGLFEGGATYVLVADSHGPGAVDITKLDPRVELMRWGWQAPWPHLLDEGFDYLVFVGQHAKSRTPLSNMAHTGNCGVLEESINGVAVGEFGRFVMQASELGVRTIFATGEVALVQEAEALVPGIETVAVKRGLVPGRGDECTAEQYRARNPGAIHSHPRKAQHLIEEGARKAMQRAQSEAFGLIPMKPPFRGVMVWRPSENKPDRTYCIREHDKSVIAMLNQPREVKLVKSREQLDELLVEPFEP